MVCLSVHPGVAVQAAVRAIAPQDTVNEVLGDQSFVARFGQSPAVDTPERLRIATHLAYVEKQLRIHTPPSDISPALYARRHHMLALLRQYRLQAVFPSQSAFPGRRPHFIDEQGRLCAVGYLIAQTAGLPLAELVNARYRYAYLPEMTDLPALTSWVAQSGLTGRELAMIQPAYEGHSPGMVSVLKPPPPSAWDNLTAPLWVPLMLSSGILFALHVAAFALPPETYQEFQTADQLITASFFSALALLTGITLLFSGTDLVSSQTMSMAVVSLPVMLLSVPLNMYAMSVLDQSMHYQLNGAEVKLGYFPVSYGSAWGLHTHFVF